MSDQEFTGLEPPPDRQCLLILNLTEIEIDAIGAAVAESGVESLYPAEESLAMICRAWRAAKREVAGANR